MSSARKTTLYFLVVAHVIPHIIGMVAFSRMRYNSSLSEHFELMCELTVADTIPVVEYKSLYTGLHVIIVNVEGPLVHGYFTLATEASDDDGLPHTLEHLIFFGSEKYPYKGVLDLIANRCLASGTNAWTDIDHTAYTVQTGESEGFLNLMPIYLDHLLYPTLTDAAFTTEVYHITDEGEDTGVVYSEMQAIENTDLKTFLEMQRAMYPEPSGYRYETGGIMKNLRESTTNEKIKSFHKKFYRPENLHLIIIGQIKAEDVLNALLPVEETIIAKGDRGPFTRPWQSEIPPLLNSIDKEVLYPSDDEDTGLVLIAWRGASVIDNYIEQISLEVLLEYLTHSSVAPLPKIFVEVDDPHASEVYSNLIQSSPSTHYLEFSGVPKAKINTIKPLVISTLTDIADQRQPFDVTMMVDILLNLILLEDNHVETNPHDTIAYNIIHDILYGNTCQDMDLRLNRKKWLIELLTKDVSYWLHLLRSYLLESPMVTIRGVPSTAEASRLQTEEMMRVEARQAALGPEGLKQLGKKIEQTMKINEIPPPIEMLEGVRIPSIEGINFHPIKTYSNLHPLDTVVDSTLQPPLEMDYKELSFKFHLDDIHSNFVKVACILDTSPVSSVLRPYLVLLLDLFFESPVRRENEIIPYEEVVKQITGDVISRNAFFGLDFDTYTFGSGPYSSNIVVTLKMEMAHYEQGIQWLHDCIFNMVFDKERITIKAKKLINSIGELKRSPEDIKDMMLHDVVLLKDTNQNQANILRQQKFLVRVLEELQNDSESVIKDLREVLHEITQIDRISVHMATDLKKLASYTDPLGPWESFIPTGQITNDWRLNIIPESKLRLDEEPGNVTGYMTGIGALESSYITQVTASITEYTHWDLPALLTAIQYLTQLEGPMWREIRGEGLAYNYRMNLSPTEGILSLTLSRTSQVADAYKAAVDIIISHLNGTRQWEDSLFESARSSLIYTVIEREAHVPDVVQQSLFAYYRQVPHSYHRDLMRKITSVTLEDVKRVSLKYMTPLVDPNTSKTVIVAPSSKLNETSMDMKKLGHNIEVFEDIDHSRFAEL